MSDEMLDRAADLIDWHFTDSDEESGCALRCGHHSDESEQSRAEHIARALEDAGLLATDEVKADAWDEGFMRALMQVQYGMGGQRNPYKEADNADA